jgi:EmrB/QacA subfamily drug resistance transporter
MMETVQTRRRTGGPLWILLTASMGCAMTVLDTNVVAIVLPSIARDLGATFAQIEWVISTYVLCFASLLLPAGSIADRFGRKRVFLIGIAFFAITSLLCGNARSAQALYVARAFQGVGAAFLLAPALAIIGHTFHGAEERDHAWAIWGGVMGLTMVLAPIIGGAVAATLGWRWTFTMNSPICLVLAGAVLLFVEESKDRKATRLDPGGILCFSGMMFGLTSWLINGQAEGWGRAITLISLATGLATLIAFVAVERFQQSPMLDLSLFRLPRFIGAVIAMFAYASCAQVMASLLPLYLQNGLGRPPLEAGVAMLPFAGAMLVFPSVGRWMGHYLNSGQILATGLAVVGAGNGIIGWGAQSGSWLVVMAGFVVVGGGGGLLNGETQKAIMVTVPQNRAGMGSGISTTSRFSGILLGFAVLSGVLASATRARIVATIGKNVGMVGGNTRKFGDAVIAGDLPRAVNGVPVDARDRMMHGAHLAYSSGFAVTLFVAAAMAGAASWTVWALMRDSAQDRRIPAVMRYLRLRQDRAPEAAKTR